MVDGHTQSWSASAAAEGAGLEGDEVPHVVQASVASAPEEEPPPPPQAVSTAEKMEQMTNELFSFIQTVL